MMKSTFTSALLASLVAGTASAGGMGEPIMEPTIIVEEAQPTAGADFLYWSILATVLIAAAASR